MVKGIFGVGKSLTIKREPFVKSPLAGKINSIIKSPETGFSVSETSPKTGGVFSTMNITKDITSNTEKSLIETPGKKIRAMRGVVVKATQETKDTWTLYIFVSEYDKDYQAGQFISISPHQFPELADLIKFFEFQKGKKEPVRAYSLTSAPHEKYVAITIKPEGYEAIPGAYPPLLSPMLASNALVGREIEFTGYAGAYVIPHDLSPSITQVVHLVAGSGIVPSFSIIKDELINRKRTHLKHLLLYVNRSMKDIIFHNELMALERSFPDRLQIKHFLSQENLNGTYGHNYVYGRPSLEHVERMVRDPKNTLFFACGAAITKWQKKQAQESGVPAKPRFMEWVHEVIEKLHVDKKHFKREIYG